MTQIENKSMTTPSKRVSDYKTFVQALWYFLGKNRYWFVLWVAVYTASQALFFYYIELNAKIINQLVDYNKTQDLNGIYFTVATMAVVISLSGIIRVLAKGQIAKISFIMEKDVKDEGMTKLMEFPITWHQKENSGNKIQRLNTGATHIKQLIHGLNNQVIPGVTSLIMTIVIFGRLNYRYIIFGILYTAIIVINEKYFYTKRKILQKRMLVHQEANAGLQYETASNILTAKATNSLSKMNSRVSDSDQKTLDVRLEMRKLSTLKWYVMHTITAFTVFAFMYLVIQDFITGILLIGNVSIMLSYYRQFRESIQDLIVSFDSVEEDRVAINRMYPIFTEKPEVYFGHEPFPVVWDGIHINNASFNYPNQTSTQYAIEKLNITINKYDKIGIVGHSGAGKSTLAKLLIGLYKLEEGQFNIGTTDFYSIEHKLITDNVTIVLQETELFNMSFIENITMLKDFDQLRFEQAINIAQLQEVLEALPNGAETLVGEKGYKLSGGQRQRVGIARAIYSDSPIIIFDEATSALDTITERLIQDALDTQLDNKTLIFIAHRLSTLKNMNRIVVFEDGQIIEDGLFEKLVNDKQSIFYELWNMQAKS
jgi:ABC-type multidrug transport system fused ATPase/permease subunit